MAVEAAPCPCHIELIARDPARNIHRRYAIEASPDLFGAIVVRTAWGRIGARGQEKTVSFDAIEDAERHVRATLRRRATSPKRNGVAYEVIDSSEANGEFWGTASLLRGQTGPAA